MKLTALNGRLINLWVSGYQFPESANDEYESNWLNITTRLDGFGQSWTSTNPCLTTWELKSLAHWFRSISSAPSEPSEITFIKPTLVFQLVIESIGLPIIRSLLSQESKPAWFEKESSFLFDVEFNDRQI